MAERGVYELKRVADYERRLERAENKAMLTGVWPQRCEICARALGVKPYAVCVDAMGYAIPTDVADEVFAAEIDAIGWLLVGPECVKSLPAEYRRLIDLR